MGESYQLPAASCQQGPSERRMLERLDPGQVLSWQPKAGGWKLDLRYRWCVLWMLLVLVIAIVVGLARGGKLSNLTEIGVRAWWLLFIGFGLQLGATFLPLSMHDLAVGLILASYVPLLLFVLLNRQMAGLWVAGIGVLMNFTVIAANSGMPVMLEAVILAGGSADVALGAKHVVLTESTHLAFLSDIIPLPGSVISLGDVFLAIGVGVFLEDQVRRPVRLFAHRVQGTPGSAAEH